METAPAQDTPESRSRWSTLVASNAFRVGIVAVSAAFIFGAWAFAEHGGRAEEPSEDSDLVLTLDDDFESAREAAESGETTAAILALERILAEDPDNARAAALLRRLRSQAAANSTGGAADAPGGSAEPGNESPGGGTESPAPRDDSAYLAAATDLRALLPEVITEWRRGNPVASDTDATVPFEAANPVDITRTLYSVHDLGSPDAAAGFVETTSKSAYSRDSAAVRVGVMDAYFGTDGGRLATVAFSRGRFAFEVVVTVPAGFPASAKDGAIALALEFEATR